MTLLERRVWIWPLVVAVLLALCGIWIRSQVDLAIRKQLETELVTLLRADVEGLKIWLETQRSNVDAAAKTKEIIELFDELAELAEQPGDLARILSQAPATAKLDAELEPWIREYGYQGFIVADRQHRILGTHAIELLGKRNLPGYHDFFAKALTGVSTVSNPFPSLIMLTDEATGVTSAGLPTMYAAAPITNPDGEILGVLGFRLRPEVDFTRILGIARGGTSGETYAFNRDGLLISQSRFDDDLKRHALIPDRPDSRSILHLELRDPGVNLKSGDRPAEDRAAWPLTLPVAAAVRGESGVNTIGYRDYRGVPSVAAWTWLPEYDFGVVTEMDRAEAYAPLGVIRTVFWGLLGMLALAALAIFLTTVAFARVQKTAQREALKVRQLGQYTLDEQIGKGAMGVVYRGHHAMLRRPTAIKLLNAEKTTPRSISRFEREVQLTSQLNHPNTICIYDYGRTPEGIFYYAMELLDGINLENLVNSAGPLPEGRVIRLLIQLCGSLNEAHGLGLIHRDIKPANVMLCQRGGMYDVVKLLDFGLVKALDAEQEAGLTAANALMGTPLYMAPEAVTNPDMVDTRSDIYSLGAVGYFLLTGTTVFSGGTLREVFRLHIEERPESLSTRLGKSVDPLLEGLLLSCLAKSPSERPNNTQELAEALATCPAAGTWGDREAQHWWAAHAGRDTVEVPSATASSLQIPKSASEMATIDAVAPPDQTRLV